MKARLIIKNFGPIDNLDIEISKFNVLIGPQGSGKSTIAKLLCIVHSYYSELLDNSDISQYLDDTPIISAVKNDNGSRFKRLLINYRIENFLRNNTFLSFDDDFFSFNYNSINPTKLITVGKKDKTINRSPSYYIPAERIALPMISESLFELTLEQSTLPNYFLQFGRDFTVARKNQKTFNIPILNVEFEHNDGRNVVVLRNNHSLLLEETSSAIQANLPLLVMLQYPIKKASLFVIEELELHGFPMLQKELLYYIIERARHPSLNNAYFVLPTHSPYILSTANNLLFAAKVAEQDKANEREVDKIISKDSWINRDDFSAYYLENGKATSIVNEQTGLIDENELDGISESLGGEFDALMELYKPAIA